MAHISHMSEAYDPDAWVFDVSLSCQLCSAQWHLTQDDKPASLWRWFFGVLPEYDGHQSTYFVKHYPAETGVSGTFLVTRCPKCGRYTMRRKP